MVKIFCLEVENNNGTTTADENNEEDLGNYITQVATDIGKSFNKELLLDKIAKVPERAKLDFMNKKLRCKMASATNPVGISCDEYSKFAIHVYQYLTYIKGLESPTMEQLTEANKLVNIDRIKENSKCYSLSSL